MRSRRGRFLINGVRPLGVLAILALILVIQACGRHMPNQPACNFVTNSNGQRVSWKSDRDIYLNVHDSVPSHFWVAMEAAVRVWNSTLVEHQIHLELGVSSPSKAKRDGFSMVYLLNDWERDRSNEQARTTVHWSGNRIYEGDILLNDKNFDFYVDDESDRTKVHLTSLMIHEIGHLLGLAHNETDGSVMNARLDNGTLREDIKNPDLESLQCEYL